MNGSTEVTAAEAVATPRGEVKRAWLLLIGAATMIATFALASYLSSQLAATLTN